ncbi:hypothetical protein [Sinorhizobium fredii]|nr:hypothetical protein [Sinorhizobium fredii]
MNTPDNAALDRLTVPQLRAIVAYLEKQLAHEQQRLRWMLEQEEDRTK